MQNKKPKSQQNLAKSPGVLTRRDLLRFSVVGAVSLSPLLALLQQGRGALAASGGFSSLADAPPKLQFPLWGDGVNWNLPQYYETIQAGTRKLPRSALRADINGDGQDELIGRSSRGLLVNAFDATAQQWNPLPGGDGLLSDPAGWNEPEYYQTIQFADIDNDSQAELVARASDSIKAWKYDGTEWKPLPDGPPLSDANNWNQAQYYQTIQFADIDGDNIAELIARDGDGIIVWKYKNGAWAQLPDGPAWSDAQKWNLPQYYQTIQCVDLDNDGHAELVARSGAGIVVWKYANGAWTQQANGPALSDANGWAAPQNYQTIQFADIDGDNSVELIARASDGIKIWKYANNAWTPMADGPAWADAYGWNQPQCYQTIQCADVDGDGQAELIGRAPDGDPKGKGLQIWKYVSGAWTQLANLAAWSDANGWNKVEYYSTIQTALVQTDADPTAKKRHVLLGRGPVSMQTWLYDASKTAFRQLSLDFPAFTALQQTAYSLLGGQMVPRLNDGGNIRSLYTDSTLPFEDILRQLYNNPPQVPYNAPPSQRPQANLPLPGGVAQADWDAVTWQIYWELFWVLSVQQWYQSVATNINNYFVGGSFTVQTVGAEMLYGASGGPSTNTPVILSIFGTIFGIAAALLGFPELEIGEAAAIAGTYGAAFGAAASLTPPSQGGGTDPVQLAYSQLQGAFANAFTGAISANLSNLTESLTDYGLLKTIGNNVATGTWRPPTASNALAASLQAGFAVPAFKALLAANQTTSAAWSQIFELGNATGNPSYPAYATYYGPKDQGKNYIWWLFNGSAPQGNYCTFPAAALDALFNARQDGNVFPLGLPTAPLFLGEDGWPAMNEIMFGGGCGPVPKPLPVAAPLSLRPDIRTVVKLARDPATNEILAFVTLKNRGAGAATNLEIRDARLSGGRLNANHSPRQSRMVVGNSRVVVLRFSPLPKGTSAILRFSGQYLGGSFGGSFRVKIP